VHKGQIEGPLKALLETDDADPIYWSRLLTDLRRKMESPRISGLRRFLNISGGLKFLLDLRADVLAAQRQTSVHLAPLDQDIADLFNSWFQHGFLFLHEITQDSPYRQIRFLKDHDMVHPMANLEEMGNRLGEDRRCFALYHRVMPEEPVVFIEVATTKGIAKSIHEIIGEQDSAVARKGTPDTAIFYSINNTQNGLAGLGLGKVLIFQVVDAIKNTDPGIKTFSTLSPIPGFWDRYLKRILEGEDEPFAVKRERFLDYFPDKAKEVILSRHAEATGQTQPDLGVALMEILSDPSWLEDAQYKRLIRKPLIEVTHFYIAHEKNRDNKPLNPVANFHLGNGASVSVNNVNFGANRSSRGLAESCGMMINYVYSRTWLQQIGRTMQSLLPWKV
jgi:hypothetical protein